MFGIDYRRYFKELDMEKRHDPKKKRDLEVTYLSPIFRKIIIGVIKKKSKLGV
jgi:hypothetical protein